MSDTEGGRGADRGGAERGASGAERGGGSGSGAAPRVVEHETRIGAAPERVWNAWADPELIAGWFMDRAVGRVEPGGRVTWVWERFGLEVEQEVVEADEPRRLVLRSRPPSGDPHVLEVTLEGAGGETVVRIVESGFGSGPEGEAAAEGADSGWVLALALLRHYVERWYGRDKSEVLTLRPASCEPEAVHAWHREPARLAEWLTAGAAGPAGEPLHPPRLALRDGRSITGRVLAESGSELVRTWDEVDGTLEFKAFPVASGGCVVGLRAVSWRMPQEELERYEPYLREAVERLARRL